MFKELVKSISNKHTVNSERKNIIIVSTPRSGSTWLMELIWSQEGFKTINEPLNVRVSRISRTLGINNFHELYDSKNESIVLDYFKKIANGGNNFLNSSPLRKQWRFRSDRIVYKIINGAEHQIKNIADVTNSQILFLMRHPYSVSLSRKVLPRLEVLVGLTEESPLYNREEHAYAANILKSGSDMEKAVLSWSLQNSLFLRSQNGQYTFLTYEELVVNPEQTLKYLAQIFSLSDYNLMLAGVKTPSAVTVQSEKGVNKEIKDGSDAMKLCTRWKSRISDEERDRLWLILEFFGLDVIYEKDSGLPSQQYMIRSISP